MRISFKALVAALVFSTSAWAQGINPVTPLTTDQIQVSKPAFANPSNFYTTPALLGPILSVPAANLTGSTLAAGVTGSSLTNLGTITSLSAVSGTFSGQLKTTFGTPTIASGACGATTNGVITSGTNQAGLVTIGSASTTTCTISFSTTITAPNACVVFPASTGAAATGTTVAYVSSITTAQFVITGSALASTAYYYICI
jgi:hypothetical protein